MPTDPLLGQSESHAVVTDPAACRLIAINAYAAWQNTLVGNPASRVADEFQRSSNPEPGDLVLETTTAFRWMRHEKLAPGEALGWLLRIENPDDRYGAVYVVRPIYEAQGEFRWSNASFIRVHTEVPRG